MKVNVMTENPEGIHAERVTTTGPLFGMGQEEFAELAGSVIVAIPHRESEGICPILAQNFGTWARFGTPIMTVPDEFGGFVEYMRNGVARTFRDYCRDRAKVKSLVFIDNDQGVSWDAPYRLAAWDLPVVSGVVANMSKARGIYACFTVEDKYGVPRFPSFMHTQRIPGQGLLKVHSVGAGLLCVQRHVFETIYEKGDFPFRIPDKYREECFKTGMQKLGEDTAFSEQVRDAGFDIHVDLSVHGEHFKRIGIVWPDNAIDHEMDVREWAVNEMDYSHG